MHKLIVMALLLMVATPISAMAYTQEDIEACTPDAMRLCQQVFPDKTRIVMCLVRNKRQLNAACTMAFNRARSMIAASERPATVEQTKF